MSARGNPLLSALAAGVSVPNPPGDPERKRGQQGPACCPHAEPLLRWNESSRPPTALLALAPVVKHTGDTRFVLPEERVVAE